MESNAELHAMRRLDEENEPFLGPDETAGVQLTPAWESRNLPPEQLNFQDVSADDSGEYGKEPPDRMSVVRLIMTLLGIGTLMPWNMFITANSYFEEYKLGEKVLGANSWYRSNFMLVMTLASQLPSFLFTWVNVFVDVGGDFTKRVVGSLVINIVVFVFTVVLAMVDTSGWPVIFFWLTILSVIVLNSANAVFQNTVYGIAAKLPPKYTGTVVLGSNISGTFTAIVSIASMAMSPNPRQSAVYYFITALFVLLACFDAYFALPLARFYRYHTRLHDVPRRSNGALPKGDVPSDENGEMEVARMPAPKTKCQKYWHTWKMCYMQGINTFLVLFVSLAVFPSVMASVQMSDETFFTGKQFFAPITVFLTFNLFAMLGNITPNYIIWPGPKWLFVPVFLRVLFIPALILCNYQPLGIERIMPVMITNDWVFFLLNIGLGFTSGYYSSLAMMYGPATVEPEYASTAGMLCGACLVSGVFFGIVFSFVPPWVVSSFTW